MASIHITIQYMPWHIIESLYKLWMSCIFFPTYPRYSCQTYVFFSDLSWFQSSGFQIYGWVIFFWVKGEKKCSVQVTWSGKTVKKNRFLIEKIFHKFISWVFIYTHTSKSHWDTSVKSLGFSWKLIWGIRIIWIWCY
jgi:hypothetical protein